MLSPISPAGERFVESVNDIQARLNLAQRRISSGLKVSEAADAPDQVSAVLQLHAEIQRNLDIQGGLGNVQAEVDGGERTLSSSVELLESAAVIATQATSITQTATTRAALGKTIEGLLEQMVLNSRLNVNGRFVFSGDADQAPSYQIDLAAAGGVARLQVAPATRMASGPNGAQFAAGLSANDIFDRRNADDTPASGNVFAALNNLRVALANNDLAGVQSAIPALTEASNHLNGQLAFYGRTQNRLASLVDQTKSLDVSLRAQLSGKTEADLTQAITELTEGQTQLQAALAAQARMPRTSLFDVLPG